METGVLVFLIALVAFVLAVVVDVYLSLAVVQPGLQARGCR